MNTLTTQSRRPCPLAETVAVVALCALFTATAVAQTAADSPPPSDALYAELGGEAGIAQLTDALMARWLTDPVLAPFFREADHKRIKKQLATQFCEVSGGPCRLQGRDRDMKVRHEGIDVTASDFNHLVEVMQQVMDAQGLAFGVQNRLLAQLAPMHRDIVNARK